MKVESVIDFDLSLLCQCFSNTACFRSMNYMKHFWNPKETLEISQFSHEIMKIMSIQKHITFTLPSHMICDNICTQFLYLLFIIIQLQTDRLYDSPPLHHSSSLIEFSYNSTLYFQTSWVFLGFYQTTRMNSLRLVESDQIFTVCNSLQYSCSELFSEVLIIHTCVPLPVSSWLVNKMFS